MRSAILLSTLAAAIVSSSSAAPAVPFNVDVPSLSLFSRFFSSLHPLLEPRLVQTCQECTPYWTNELGKHWLFFRGIHFFDLNEEYYKGPLPIHISTVEAKFPSKLSHQKILNGTVFEEISEKGPRENLKKFTSFRTRYYRSSTGRESQLWLMGMAELIASSRKDLDITVSELKHSWGQNSIILHIPGKGSKAAKEEGITILGAHQDSTNLIPFLAAPGADDDGSGTVTLLEALRALLATGWAPATPVEFHWYSAEEGGLLGSQEVVRAYVEKGIKVKAMLQQDMTAFVKAGTQERVGLVTDFTNANLNEFIRLLIKTYLTIPVVDSLLGRFLDQGRCPSFIRNRERVQGLQFTEYSLYPRYNGPGRIQLQPYDAICAAFDFFRRGNGRLGGQVGSEASAKAGSKSRFPARCIPPTHQGQSNTSFTLTNTAGRIGE